jgi:Fe2+ or Zn2+ uptake regulation protein
LIEFSSDEVAAIRDAVAAKHRFQPQGHRLIVTGLCADCRTSRSKSRHQDRV